MKTQEKKSVTTLLKISVLCFVCLLLSTSASSSKKVLNDLPIKKWFTVCHFGQSLNVNEAGLKSHLGHGDGIGRCGQTPLPDQD